MKNKIITVVITVSSIVFFSSCGENEIKEENTSNKNTVTIAYYDSSDSYSSQTVNNTLNRLINEFNNLDTGITAEKKVYESDDKLYMDISSGKIPDIIFDNGFIDTTTLYRKGVLCNLYENPNFDKNEYVSSVIDSMEIDGCLYSIPYSFTIESAMVKDKLWGNDNDTSFKHIMKKAQETSCSIPIDLTLDTYSFTSYVTSNFINLKDGKCNFTDGKFEEFLKYIKNCASTVNNLSNEEIYEKFKSDDVLVITSGFAGFDQIDYIENDIHDKIKYIGFPSDNENYHIAIPSCTFSLTNDSTNKDNAFKFILFATSYDAYIYKEQDAEMLAGDSSGFSINKKVLEFAKEDSIEMNLYKLEEEQKKENNEEILSQINSVNVVANKSYDVIGNILSEELSAYFNNQKDEKTVCENIQNRLSVYFSEQYN